MRGFPAFPSTPCRRAMDDASQGRRHFLFTYDGLQGIVSFFIAQASFFISRSTRFPARH